jgi:hypothetical protein
MKLENAWYNFITENNIATENEVNLVTDISGYSESTFLAIAYARTGYRSYEQLLDDGYLANEKLSEYYDI